MHVDFAGRGLLLDIEGTTSSVRFVYDVLFPYVREHLEEFLRPQWSNLAVQAALQQLASDAGRGEPWAAALGADDNQQGLAWVQEEVRRLMDADAKTTGLKMLQGLIWESGFHSGRLVSHVYPEVHPRLKQWRSEGWDIRVYSSGSVHAQRLFFAYTVVGDLLSMFNGHYDTSVGSKRDSASYARIAEEFVCPANEILFVSDIPQELDAAKQAGLATALCVRPENALVEQGDHQRVDSFDDLRLTRIDA